MNNINMIGNLGRDPQINAAGTMASFSLAVKRQYKDQQSGEYKTDWFNCKAFNKTAELIHKHFFKGSQIAFSGRLQNNHYEKDGQMVYRDEIHVDSVTFIGQKIDVSERCDNGQVNNQRNNSNQSGGQNGGYNSNKKQNGFDDFNYNADPFANSEPVDIDDDDLPF
jgi:single-strand DNA-binding protein